MSQFPLPNLFIPGVQKAGTTALASFLAQHPDVCLVEGKEAHVFDDPDFHASSNKLEFARQKYASKLKHYKAERYILDATPITILHPKFIEAVSTYCPNAKHIVMLRDPVERALSHYAMSKERGLEPFSPMRAFWQERARMKGFYAGLPTSLFESPFRDQSYLMRSRYQRQLTSLYEAVEKDKVKVIQQDLLLSCHDKVMSDIFSFLNISNVNIEQKKVFSSEHDYSFSLVYRWLLKFYFVLRN